MKVLIVGSLRDNPSEQKREAFVAACREIGAALALAKFDFVIGSSSPNTADKWVLEGAASIEGVYKLLAFRPDDGPTIKPPSGETVKGKFVVSYRRLRGRWAGGRISQIQAADCVILIGGARGTAQVGYTAMALEKPVVAIASFDGSAAEMWPILEPFYERLARTKDRVGNLREEWQAGNGEIVIEVLTELTRRKVFRRTRLVTDLLPLVFTVVLFTTWVWLFVAPPQPWQASFFGLLAVSAFLGTALRGTLRAILDPLDSLSRGVLFAEFSAGLVVAFALALLYLLGSLTFTGSFRTISSTAALDDYQRVAASLALLGIAGGWLIERVAEYLKDWLSGQFLPDDGT